MSYEIKLPLFQGPFDLLLFFIERDELDIRDIPIAKITEDFLAYLLYLKELNLELASEFILVAATLMQIKTKMLLPRPVVDNLGIEVDPREELIKHLIEYKKYKSVVGTLADWEENRLMLEKRGNTLAEIKSLSENNLIESELQDLDLYKLLKVYMKILSKYDAEQNKPIHTVSPYPYTMDGQKEFILDNLRKHQKLNFVEIIEKMPEKIALIFNFLSILELLQNQIITITIGEGYNNFWIMLQPMPMANTTINV